MIKIPTYIECFEKFVNFLGLDYSNGVTNKFRLEQLRDFSEQAKSYENKYVPKILNLFANDDEDKQKDIKFLLTVSESFTRYLNNQEYCSIATRKKVIWGLLVCCYIPCLAYFIAYQKEKYGLSNHLIENDFMLPVLKNDGTVVTPAKRLKVFLHSIKKQISSKNDVNVLETYLAKLNDKNVARYQTHEKIIKIIQDEQNLNEFEKNKISILFRTAIISGRIYQKLLKFFEDKNIVINLVNHFLTCLKISENLFNNNDSSNDLFSENLIGIYNANFYHELKIENYLNKYNLISLKDIKELEILLTDRNEIRKNIVFCFEQFILRSESMDDADVFSSYEILFPSSNFIHPHSRITKLLENLSNTLFSSTTKFLPEEISYLFQEIENDSFFELYEHKYLYCKAFNYLAENDFKNAVNTFIEVVEKCKKINAAPVQFKAIKKLIILLPLTEGTKWNYQSLNPYIKIMSDIEPENISAIITETGTLPEQNEINKKINFKKITEIICEFNSKGYALYEGFECIKFNPFDMLERFIGDFYDAYASDTKEYESNQKKLTSVIIELTAQKKPYHNNLVSLYQYKIKDVFNGTTLEEICLFLNHSNIESKNIYKITEDTKMRELIFEAVST